MNKPSDLTVLDENSARARARQHASAIDLRSDTVTRPSDAMRRTMAAAAVGDDQFGEDPTINDLQQRCAALLGKEAAIWLPTGTMANQVALQVLTRPGDDVIVSRQSHAVWHEAGASAANAGVQFTEIGQRGSFTAEEFLAARKPRGHALFPPTTLVEVENTHNRAGGVIVPQHEASAVCAAARGLGVATYLDGSRLWNASVATGIRVPDLVAPFDVVSVSFSKGLGAPGGAALAGPRDVIARAVRARRMLGGAMRQVGFFAAAALYALDCHVDRLVDDHTHARLIAARLAGCTHVDLDLASVQTNIVIFNLREEGMDAATFVEGARRRGVLVVAFGPRTVRAVTHLDVTREQCEQAGEILGEVAET
jgi:threonine aldolase